MEISAATRRRITPSAIAVGVLTALLAGSLISGASAAATAAPKSSALPKITGLAKQGQTLTTSKGVWKNAPTSFKYQWRRCSSAGKACANVAGAKKSTYLVAAADVGHTLRVIVTVKNTSGSASSTS